MAHQSWNRNAAAGGASPSWASGGAARRGDQAADNKNCKRKVVEKLVLDIGDPDLRENALHELSKKRYQLRYLPSLLWSSFGTIAVLLQEIVSIYPTLSPPNLALAQSNKVCNALVLLQRVASHPETRVSLVNACIPLYLYPFLSTTSKARSFEHLRLTSLSVIRTLVKVDDTAVICFLLSTEAIPPLLCAMENGFELSKSAAISILQRILLNDVGLERICASPVQFFAVNRVLGNMVGALTLQPSSQLLECIIGCYLRLSDNEMGLKVLRNSLPDMLKDGTFNNSLREDPTTRRCLQKLLYNIQGPLLPLQGGRKIWTYAGHQNWTQCNQHLSTIVGFPV
ncbi:Cell differentiation [Forsythia ovata]|uniref:Cell differentiation n=1 Tax=Forsythia ovata TaxID=205694 RepID=A0ABD1R5M9_9LAMI